MIHLAQKHSLLPNPERIVPVKPAVNYIFFLGFRMKSHIFNNVILILEMLIYSVDFYFAFFHYFVPPSSIVTAAYVASRRLHELKLFNSASKTLAHLQLLHFLQQLKFIHFQLLQNLQQLSLQFIQSSPNCRQLVDSSTYPSYLPITFLALSTTSSFKLSGASTSTAGPNPTTQLKTCCL